MENGSEQDAGRQYEPPCVEGCLHDWKMVVQCIDWSGVPADVYVCRKCEAAMLRDREWKEDGRLEYHVAGHLWGYCGCLADEPYDGAYSFESEHFLTERLASDDPQEAWRAASPRLREKLIFHGWPWKTW